MHKVGTAPASEAGDRASGDASAEGSLARVLRREARALHGEAGEEEPDVVDCWLFGGEDDARGPVASRYDFARGR